MRSNFPGGFQLLRIFASVSQEAGDANIGVTGLVAQAVGAADCQRHLSGVLGFASEGRQQQHGPTCGAAE